MTEQISAVATPSPKEVDRIRDIIFGGQMREYAQRFHSIERDLSGSSLPSTPSTSSWPTRAATTTRGCRRCAKSAPG